MTTLGKCASPGVRGQSSPIPALCATRGYSPKRSEASVLAPPPEQEHVILVWVRGLAR